MAKKRKPGRPKTKETQTRQLNFRLTESEYAVIREAAGRYPVATWARVELLRAAESEISKRGKR